MAWGTCHPGALEPCVTLGTATLVIASSTLSVLGCVAIFALICRSRLMVTSRWILLWIAVSDLVSSLGYIFASSFFIVLTREGSELHPPTCIGEYPSENATFCSLCAAQSFITTSSSMWSFFWTSILAIHLYICIVHKKDTLSRRLLPVYHVVAWSVGPIICIIAVVLRYLGPGDNRLSASWCYITAGTQNQSLVAKNYQTEEVSLAFELLAGEFWLVLTILITAVFYLAATVVLCRRRRSTESGSVVTVEFRILLVPLLFFLIRAWGMVRFFISLAILGGEWKKIASLVNHPFLLNMEAIGDPAQGWINAIVFVLLSNRVRSAIHKWCCFVCLHGDENIDRVNFSSRLAQRREVRRVEETQRLLVTANTANESSNVANSGSYGSVNRQRSLAAGGYRQSVLTSSETGDKVHTPITSEDGLYRY